MVSIAAPHAGDVAQLGRVAGRGRWRLAGALLLLLAAGISSLAGVFEGAGWWFATVLIAALVLAAAATARSLGVPRAIGTLIAACVLLLALTIGFDTGTTVLGIIPTPATFAHFGDLVVRAFVSANQQEVPANVVIPLLFLLEAGIGLAALLADILAVVFRAPAACGVVLAGILAIPLFLLPGGVSVLWLVACAAAYLFLLRVGMVSHGPGIGQRVSALAMAAASIVIALVVSTTAPGFLSGVNASVGPSMSFGYGSSPLIDLSKNLRKPTAVDILSYNSSVASGEYLSLVSLDQFTNGTWTYNAGALRALGPSSRLGQVPGLSSGVASKRVRTDIQTADVRSPWLPVPYPARVVSGVGSAWVWDSDDLSVSSRTADAGNRSYTVSSLRLEPTPKQLRQDAGPLPPGISQDEVLPRSVPSIITKTAHQVTAGSNDHYEQAVALQNYFRGGAFTYSLNAPVAEGDGGGGLAVIAAFLKQKTGYCVHFASAMAIMARVLGIPSRVTIGYLPGMPTGANVGGRSTFTVTSDQLHAWPELYFSGVGWVRFEPTVSLGVVPGYSLPASTTAPTTAPLPSVAPAPTSQAGPTVAPEISSDGQTGGGAGGPAITPAGIIVVVLALLCAPAAFRRWRRRARLRRLQDGDASVTVAWDELRDTMRDLGWAVSPTDTPRAFARRLLAGTGGRAAGDGALARLLAGVERARFGPPDAAMRLADLAWADDLRTVLAAVTHDASTGARITAFLVPASLFTILLPRREAPGYAA